VRFIILTEETFRVLLEGLGAWLEVDSGSDSHEETRGSDDTGRPLQVAGLVDREVSNVRARGRLLSDALLGRLRGKDTADGRGGNGQVRSQGAADALADEVLLVMVGGSRSSDINEGLQMSRPIGIVLSRGDERHDDDPTIQISVGAEVRAHIVSANTSRVNRRSGGQSGADAIGV